MRAGTPVHAHSFCSATAQCINQACRGAVEGLTPSFPTLGGFTDLLGLNAELRKRNGAQWVPAISPGCLWLATKETLLFIIHPLDHILFLRFNFKIKF